MDLNTFAKKVSQCEGLKKQVDIAQIKEILRVVNDLTHGLLYIIVKGFLRK